MTIEVDVENINLGTGSSIPKTVKGNAAARIEERKKK